MVAAAPVFNLYSAQVVHCVNADENWLRRTFADHHLAIGTSLGHTQGQGGRGIWKEGRKPDGNTRPLA